MEGFHICRDFAVAVVLILAAFVVGAGCPGKLVELVYCLMFFVVKEEQRIVVAMFVVFVTATATVIALFAAIVGVVEIASK